MPPAARLGDMTVHGGTIGPIVTGVAARVMIGKKPAACQGDPQICPMSDGPKPHVGGTIVLGSLTVMIGNKPAARVGDMHECKGPPGTIAPPGEPTVMIGDMGMGRVGGAAGPVAVAMGAPSTGVAEAGPAEHEAVQISTLQAASAAGMPLCEDCGYGSSDDPGPANPVGPVEPEEETEKTWIGIRLLDADDTPIANQQFQATMQGGQTLSGQTDEQGFARFDDLEPDSGEVAFVNIPVDDTETDLEPDESHSSTEGVELGDGAEKAYAEGFEFVEPGQGLVDPETAQEDADL